MFSQRFHLQLRRALLQRIDVLPADRLEDVELAGAQRGDPGRLVLDGAIDDLVDERQLVLLAADLLAAPVERVLGVGVGVAGDVVGELEGAGADRVLPVGGAGVDHLLGVDRRVVAPAEAVVPLGVEVLHVEDDRVLVRRLDLRDVVEVALLLLGARDQAVEAEGHVLRRELAALHDARLLGEHHALAQLDLDPERVLLPLPALGQLALDRVLRQVAVGHEGVRAAAALGLRQVALEELFEVLAGVVVQLPVPVVGIERQRRQRHVDGADLERAAVLRLVARLGDGGRRRQGRETTRYRAERHALPDFIEPSLFSGCRACADRADRAARRRRR